MKLLQCRNRCLLAMIVFQSTWGNWSNCSAEDAKQPLPLKRVVVLNSGVGYFEHSGRIDGNRQVEFPVKADDINDLLKSLTVQDQGGGRITAVNYGSPEPISQTLKSLAIDVTRNPSLSQIFHQLRGQDIELTIASAANPIRGTIAGVERRKILSRDQQAIDHDLVLLRMETGLRSVTVDSITVTRFLDEKTDREFQQALSLLAESRKQDQKAIKLDFRGKGQRDVIVGYVQESPVWKTTYRLVIAKGKEPFLQGWAIVENTTAQDWTDVDLTLMSGRPVSFQMDLYQPLYASRPFAELELHTSVEPRRYNQDLAAREDEFLAAGRPANPALANANQQRPMMAGMGGGMMGGGMGGMGGGMGGMGGGMGGMGGGFGGFGGADAAVSRKAPARNPIDLSRGVASAASAEDIGESYRYVIKNPVTLRRNESSMLPIVNELVKGEKVYIFNPAVHAKHPLAGLKLKNSTELHLQQGPITVFEGDEYAGDAQISDIPPGSTRLISYAMDLDTEIVAEASVTKQALVGLSITSGGLILKQHSTRQSRYLIKNSGADAKSLLIERPVDSAWPNVEPKPAEKTRDLYRFAATAAPGKPVTVTVTEDAESKEELFLRNLDLTQFNFFVHSDHASPAIREALKELIRRKTKLESFSAATAAVEKSIREETAEQTRLRDNLRALSESDTLKQRYVQKLAASEDALEGLRQKLSSVKKEEEQFKAEYEKFAAELTVP